MMGLLSLGLAATAAMVVTHEPHGCPEAPHQYEWACQCARSGGYSHPAAPPYLYARSYLLPGSYLRPPVYYGPPAYQPPPYQPPLVYHRPPAYHVRGRPVRAQSAPVYIEGPPVYIDAPPVYVEPAQVYVERPQIIVRPSEVIVAPPEVHFESCPEGADCRQAPADYSQPSVDGS